MRNLAPVAQRIERRFPKPCVAGSNPAGGARKVQVTGLNYSTKIFLSFKWELIGNETVLGSFRGWTLRSTREGYLESQYVGYDQATGKQPLCGYRTIHGTKRHAEDVLSQLLVEVGVGSTVSTEATVNELVARWLEITSDSVSPTTLNEYKRLLDKHILSNFGKRKVRSLRASELDTFYTRLKKSGGSSGNGLSAQSVRHIHAIIHRIFSQAVKWGWASSNP